MPDTAHACPVCRKSVRVKDGIEQSHDENCYLDGVATVQIEDTDALWTPEEML